MTTTFISVKTRCELVHHWPDAPAEVSYLRNLHRHELHLSLKIQVHHGDRELEFIIVKHRLEQFLRDDRRDWPQAISCEQIGKRILAWAIGWVKLCSGDPLRAIEVGVYEDGENGAELRYDPHAQEDGK